MSFLRLPRLPVSRRRVDELAELVCAYNRIASEDLAEYKRRARKAEARVAELEQTIREHASQPLNAHGSAAGLVQVMMTRDRRLHSVLDGHEETPAERWQSPDEAGADAQAHHRQERGGDTGGLSDLTREEYDRLRQAAGEADGDIRQERELCEHTGQPVGPNSRYGCGCHHCEP